MNNLLFLPIVMILKIIGYPIVEAYYFALVRNEEVCASTVNYKCYWTELTQLAQLLIFKAKLCTGSNIALCK